MPLEQELSTVERLKAAQAKVKALAGDRDRVIREAGAQERKLEEAYEKLRELGIESPEKMTSKQLQTMAEQLREQLTEKLGTIETQIAKGEKLMAQYNAIEEN